MTTDVLTLQDLAVALCVSSKTARRLVTRGRVLGFRVGSQWRVRRSALDAYIDTQQYLAKRKRGEATVTPSVRDLKGWDRFR